MVHPPTPDAHRSATGTPNAFSDGQSGRAIDPEATAALESYKARDLQKSTPMLFASKDIQTDVSLPKVVVRFKAVGNAPIMKQNFYKITASNKFQTVISFLRKELGWKSADPLVGSLPYWSKLPN